MSLGIAAGVLLFIATAAAGRTNKRGKPLRWKRDPWKTPKRW